jgi:NTE family protein
MVQKADAVFEGGGVRGIGFVGALEVFEQSGFEWQNLAGTSAGAIMATLLAVGYRASEVREIMTHRVNFREMMDASAMGRLPVVGRWLSTALERGMYRGDFFLELMRGLIAEKMGKEKVTFGDLVMPKEPGDSEADYEKRFKYKLQVIAADLSASEMLILPRDIARLGVDPDHLEVALAVRMSMSIPFFFRPVVFGEGQEDRDPHWIVDGGLLSSFPIWLFDSPPGQLPAWPTIGFLLRGPTAGQPLYRRIRGPLSMALGMTCAMNRAMDLKVLERADRSRIVEIPTGHVVSTDFDLTPSDQEFLYNNGLSAGQEFIQGWSFDQYVAQRVSQDLDATRTV